MTTLTYWGYLIIACAVGWYLGSSQPWRLFSERKRLAYESDPQVLAGVVWPAPNDDRWMWENGYRLDSARIKDENFSIEGKVDTRNLNGILWRDGICIRVTELEKPLQTEVHRYIVAVLMCSHKEYVLSKLERMETENQKQLEGMRSDTK